MGRLPRCRWQRSHIQWSFTSKPPVSLASSPIHTPFRPRSSSTRLGLRRSIDRQRRLHRQRTRHGHGDDRQLAAGGKRGTRSGRLAGDLIHLTGAGSTDVDGNPLTYAWSLTTRPAGSTAVLSSPTAVNPTFVVDRSGAYTAQLIVNDGTVDSAPDVVSISTQNQRPVANAGPSQTVAAGAPVQLDGSGSSDPNGDALTFKWSLLSRPREATPNSRTRRSPTRHSWPTWSAPTSHSSSSMTASWTAIPPA